MDCPCNTTPTALHSTAQDRAAHPGYATALAADDWGQRMTASYPAFRATRLAEQEQLAAANAVAAAMTANRQAEHQAVCSAFSQQAMTPLNRDPMVLPNRKLAAWLSVVG